jgi:hypothetical protein
VQDLLSYKIIVQVNLWKARVLLASITQFSEKYVYTPALQKRMLKAKVFWDVMP